MTGFFRALWNGMYVFDDIPGLRRQLTSCVATIGKYDGMHLGHQQVLNALCEQGKRHGLPTVVVLSEPHPEEFFSPDNAPARLTHFHDKVEFLRQAGIDAVFRLRFDRTLSAMSAEQFVDSFLVAGLGVKVLIVGDDFRFGSGRAGDFSLLREKGAAAGFQVHREVPFVFEGKRVSSTRVRTCLEQGDCEQASRLLGRPYSISGIVITGKQLGRELGVPTANLALEMPGLPLTGIYIVLADVAGNSCRGVASAGYNPTVDAAAKPSLEAHLFDFRDDIYGERLRVSFLKKLRNEAKFDSLETLKRQMDADIAAAQAYFSAADDVAQGRVDG